MVRALLALLLALSIISSGVHVLANVEKLVFVPGPQAQVAEPLTGFPPPPLFRLSPDTTPRVRVTLNTSFPSATAAAVQGSAVWVALDALTVGQRYEVRICWAATVRYIPRTAGVSPGGVLIRVKKDSCRFYVAPVLYSGLWRVPATASRERELGATVVPSNLIQCQLLHHR